MKLTNQGKVTPPIKIDYDDVKTCIYRLNSLNHPTRRRILVAIDKLDENATTSNITQAISLDQKVVTKHLNILVRGAMVDRRKTTGQKILFSINQENIQKANRFIKEINSSS